MVYLVTAGFIALDMLTGIVKAFKEKNFTSSVMREGLFHKCGSIITVVFAVGQRLEHDMRIDCLIVNCF